MRKLGDNFRLSAYHQISAARELNEVIQDRLETSGKSASYAFVEYF